jgi:hypothetical protein
VEETLLLLYSKEKVIAELEIIASRAPALPAERREAVNKVLDKARTLLEKDESLSDEEKNSQFRAYLKTALEAINWERNEFYWYRGAYRTQVSILPTSLAPLLEV